MLIGIDASRANRKFKGGTEWYSYYLIRELAKIDSKNQYILYSDKPLSGGLVDLTGETNRTDYKTKIDKGGWQKITSRHNNFEAKILNWPFTYFWTQIRLSWEMFFYPPDVLFIPAHTLPFIHPAKSVVTIHDIGFERDQGLYGSDKIGPREFISEKIVNLLVSLFTHGKFKPNVLDYHSWSVRFALKHAKAIIAVSNFTRNEIIDVYHAGKNKIKVVYNGFNDAIYKKIESSEKIEQVLDKYGIKSPYIFYVGRLEKKKNTPALVNAYAIMREKYKNIRHKLVLAGNASLGFDEVKYVIQEFNLNEEVIITGWIPEPDLPYIYNGASLFVFPSCYEGFGIPLLQAMACSVPIAASAIAPLLEIAAGAAWFFNPQDKYDMAEKMAEVLLDKKLANGLINGGASRVKDFSLAKCAKETLAALEKL